MVNRWVTAALILTVLSLLGSAIVISQVAQGTGGGSGESNANCPNGQFATSESSNGSFFCGAQNVVSTEAAAGCPANQFATTESANGGLGCATALTTQTLVSTEMAGGCSSLNFYVTTESSNGTFSCARVNQGFNQTGLQLYAQLDEGSGSIIYDLSKNHVVGSAANSPAWLSAQNCIFNQFCLGFTAAANHTVSLGHSYDDHLSDPITMCVWYFATNTPTTSYNLFGDLTSAGTNGFQMQFNQNTTFSFSRTASAGIIFVTTTSTFATNHWHFVCGTYDGHKNAILVDGLFQKSIADGNAMMGLPVTYMLGNTPRGVQLNTGYLTGRLSAFYQYQQALDNSSVLALYEYVPYPTEQNPVLWQQLTGFPSNCPANQFVIGVTTTLSCSLQSAVTTEKAAGCPGAQQFATTESANGDFSCDIVTYGTCPANQFATAITTTTLNCGAVSTEAIASCSTGQFATTESAAGGFGCGNPNIQFVTNSSTCTDTTLTTKLMAGLGVSYTPNGTGKVSVTLNWQISTPATSGINTKYQLAFGTGKQPTCNQAVTGATVGQQFEVGTFAAVASFEQPSISAGVFTLTAGTRYWWDLQVSDSSTASWTYSLPQLTVVES